MIPFTEIKTQQSQRKGGKKHSSSGTSLETKKGNEKRAVAQEYQHLWGRNISLYIYIQFMIVSIYLYTFYLGTQATNLSSFLDKGVECPQQDRDSDIPGTDGHHTAGMRKTTPKK